MIDCYDQAEASTSYHANEIISSNNDSSSAQSAANEVLAVTSTLFPIPSTSSDSPNLMPNIPGGSIVVSDPGDPITCVIVGGKRDRSCYEAQLAKEVPFVNDRLAFLFNCSYNFIGLFNRRCNIID